MLGTSGMDRKKSVMALAIGIFVCGAFGAAQANTIVVNDDGDIPIAGKCILRGAIENHNTRSAKNPGCGAGSIEDTILTPPQVTLRRALPVMRRALPVIANTLTLGGNRASCDVIQGGYFATTSGTNLTFKGVGISNGSSGFTQERSLIENEGGVVTILPGATRGCLFSNHEKNAEIQGGVIANRHEGTVLIEGAELENNSAIRGGAIHNDGGTIRIVGKHVSLSRNTAKIEGGAIYSNGGSVTIVGIAGQSKEPIIARNRAVFGGGISTLNTKVEISNIEVSENSTTGTGGGPIGAGIYMEGSVATIKQSYLHDNDSDGTGGAIFSRGSNLLVSRTTFRHNRAHGVGGSIFQDRDGQLKVINTTINGERFNSDVEGIHCNSGTVQVVNSTIEKARLQGNVSVPFAVRNSILLDSSCFFVRDDGFNIQYGNQINCPDSIPRDNPMVRALRDNGGPTLTSGLDEESPAIDAIPTPDCTDEEGNPVKVDQRGFARPGRTACDIGAFEVDAKAP